MKISETITKIASTVLLFTIFLFLTAEPSAAAENLKTNVLIYMIGSDLESHDEAATKDIKEMLYAAKNFGDEVSLIVYGGGANEWHNDIFSSDENRCVRIDKNGAELLYTEPTRNMTDPATLADYIKYCGEHYPADRNILVLWDHGSGYLYGADELNSAGGPMTPMDILSALEQGGTRFDILGFDACMMASFEVAYSVCEYGEYMVASQEMEPSGGWNYAGWLSELAKCPEISSVELAKTIVDTYIEWCKVNAPGIKDALSVIDLKMMLRAVPEELSSFSKEMINNLQAGKYDIVSVQKALFFNISNTNKADMIDAIQFAGSLTMEKARRLETVLRESVIYNRKDPANLDINGVLLHVPISGSVLGMNIDNLEALKASGISDIYVDWLTCCRKFISFAREQQGHERTLMDILKGTEKNELEDEIHSIIDETRLDVTGCYLIIDENNLPQLIMPEEKKRLVTYIGETICKERENETIDYGFFYFIPDVFPLAHTGIWDKLSNGWLYINDILCPFYMEEETVLSSGRIAVYGYTKMCRNGDEGSLYLRLVYDDRDDSFVIEPLCFQEVSSVMSDVPFGRVLPVANIDPEDAVYFICSSHTGKGESYQIRRTNDDMQWKDESFQMKRITDDMQWKDITAYEWKNTTELDEVTVGFGVADLFGNGHELELISSN